MTRETVEILKTHKEGLVPDFLGMFHLGFVHCGTAASFNKSLSLTNRQLQAFSVPCIPFFLFFYFFCRRHNSFFLFFVVVKTAFY